LGRSAGVGFLFSHRQVTDLVAVGVGDPIGPTGELGTGPLETVVAVPKGPSFQSLVVRVVFGVGCGDDDDAWGGPGEHDVLHGGQPGGVDVFDDLHEYGCVMVGETPVPVQDRADEQVGAGSLPVRGGSFLEQIRPVSLPGPCTPPAGRPVGAFEAVDVDVHATDPSQSGFLDQALQEFAAATAQIDDAADPFGVQHGQDRTDPLFGQVGPAFLQVWCGGGLLHRRV